MKRFGWFVVVLFLFRSIHGGGVGGGGGIKVEGRDKV